MFNKRFSLKAKWAHELAQVPQATRTEESDQQEADCVGQQLEALLGKFGIEAQLLHISRGPAVTRYKLKFTTAITKKQCAGLSKKIEANLGLDHVYVEIPVRNEPGVMHIEVPNRERKIPALREILESPEFANAGSELTVALGRDVENNVVLVDIAGLPHLLIGGMTGSGKSALLRAMIVSLLKKATPEEVRLVLIDPKMVELGIYNGVPHLLVPTLTDVKKALGALQWVNAEIMRRYKIMAEANVRSFKAYNERIEGREITGDKLPRIVVIIDEISDLMMAATNEEETAICRITQMGRAVGVHLILATQRPAGAVVTGLMKANIPSRIAFAVSNIWESRFILEDRGAEKLIGRGDMFYAPIGNGKPIRVQGCFVSEVEIEAAVALAKSNYDTSYDQQVLEKIERKAAQTGGMPDVSDPEPNAG